MSMRTAAYATLFQGMVALPVALGLSVLIALGTMIAMLTAPDSKPRIGAARVSYLTGGVLAATGLVFVILHAVA